jgi:hypothetical protein
MFAVAFLQCIDYVYPEKFDVSQREIKLIDFYIDRNKFQQYISIATK